MGRHTGFLLLAVLTGIAVGAIAGRKDLTPSQPQPLTQVSAAMVVHPVGLTTPKSPDTSVVLKSLRPDSLVIIGSLDTSGAPHEVEIEVQRSPVARASFMAATAVTNRPIVHSENSLRNPPVESPLAREQTVPLTTGETESRRCFRVPRFEPTGTRREVCETNLIVKTPRACVYVENAIQTSFEVTGKTVLGELCDLLERQSIDLVRNGIGAIADVDADGTLAIVIADLDRHDARHHPPVRGCVTDHDFLLQGESDFAGDVIYLDLDLPSGEELATLLAHELTHAAVLSFQLRQQQPGTEIRTASAEFESVQRQQSCAIPAWLNEAAAHWMEHRITDDVPEFSERMSAFQRRSSQSPIVASEEYLTFASRRSGSRAAGYLFLKSLLTSDEQLRQFVLNDLSLEDRVELLSGVTFREVFRAWMLEVAMVVEADEIDSSGNRYDVETRQLFGTAVLCIRLPNGANSISISSDSNSRLEVISR